MPWNLRRDRQSLPNPVISLLLVLTAGLVLLPVAIAVWTSLQPPGAVLGLDEGDRALTLANYQQAWRQGQFWLAFANSTLVAIATCLGQLITSALAGYALARLRFRGRQALLVAVVTTLAIPFQVLVIPVFLVLKWGQLIDTYWALILPAAASSFGIFLMRQHFVSQPLALEEAACLDGANRLQVLWYIVLPLARPALATLFLFTFIGEWNDLFKPLIFTTRPELRTVQLALAQFQEQFTSNWPLLMAAVTMATLPMLLLFVLVQRQLTRGISTTGLKN
ncbi:MAG: carbohydrate ABC transporter permease [Spirulinaceae cyanobacterium SM2_1_0]|nr:carbohydrate ABC transporter permease [Spirulinaceae cyanobacterium SM2_1_0]